MDKRTILGIILIVIITLLMPYYYKWTVGEQPPSQPPIARDTLAREEKPVEVEAAKEISPTLPQAEIATLAKESFTPLSGIDTTAREKQIRIETKYINAVLSTKHGGNFLRWELKNYAYYLGGNVNLARNNNGLDVELMDRDGNNIQLTDYTLFTNIKGDTSIILNEDSPTTAIEFYLPVKSGRITKKYIFHHDDYAIEVIIKLENLQGVVVNRRYYLNWENGLAATEENQTEDYSYARAYIYQGGELDNIDVSDEEKVVEEYSGRVDWTAIRTKYFLVSLIPATPQKVQSAILSGVGKKEEDLLLKSYSSSLELPITQSMTQEDTFAVFIGPLDYNILKSYGVDLQKLVMNRDWYERIFRPISLLILPAFKFLYGFIPNYGLVIIIFSILIKLLLHPLTKKSYASMSEMQYLQPKMTQLKEQYKNDPQRLNQEMMKLYKEHGVNPLGGCLPMMLQMPLLFALFIVFRSTIQLRGEPFILWITDLSRPDTLPLGFTLPFIGDSIHILPLLMGLTMIWQSKMTVTDPKQKFMVYFMPFFMIFIFYSLPSGLNLYYSIFNLLSMFQTRLIKKKMHPGNNGDDQKPLKKAPPARKPAPKKSKKKRS